MGSVCSGKEGSLSSGKGGSVWFGKLGSHSPDFPILATVSDLPYYDTWLVKMNAQGDTLWTRYYTDSIGGESAQSIIQASDGGFVMAGTTYSTGPGNRDALLFKTDPFGNLLWTRTYGRDSTWEDILALEESQDGGFLLAGRQLDTTSSFYYDMILLKTDSIGLTDCLYSSKTINATTIPCTISVPQLNIYATPTYVGIPVFQEKSGVGDSLYCGSFAGVREEFQLQEIDLVPNPAQHSFRIIMPENISHMNLVVVDRLGRVCLTNTYNKDEEILLSDLTQGVYTVILQNQICCFAAKLLILHE